jgi:nitrile hydratase accessory protein
LFRPEDPLAPREPAFVEPWHAQALALADSLVRAGAFTATEWGEALGAALKAVNARGLPDNTETYYTAVVEALETLSESRTGISEAERRHRHDAWKRAYLSTPHGHPVTLPGNILG